jgi:hypothetical protein
MRGKLRDKRDMKRERTKRELLMGRKPSKKDHRNLQLLQPMEDDDDYLLDEEGELMIEEEQKN